MKTVLNLPDLTDEHWRVALSTFASKVNIPAARPGDHEAYLNPARRELVSAIAAHQGLDELPQDHPWVTETLGPFQNLTETEAMTVLFVNNLLWDTGEALWLQGQEPVA